LFITFFFLLVPEHDAAGQQLCQKAWPLRAENTALGAAVIAAIKEAISASSAWLADEIGAEF
jgi:hypothetical protein